MVVSLIHVVLLAGVLAKALDVCIPIFLRGKGMVIDIAVICHLQKTSFHHFSRGAGFSCNKYAVEVSSNLAQKKGRQRCTESFFYPGFENQKHQKCAESLTNLALDTHTHISTPHTDQVRNNIHVKSFVLF